MQDFVHQQYCTCPFRTVKRKPYTLNLSPQDLIQKDLHAPGAPLNAPNTLKSWMPHDSQKPPTNIEAWLRNPVCLFGCFLWALVLWGYSSRLSEAGSYINPKLQAPIKHTRQKTLPHTLIPSPRPSTTLNLMPNVLFRCCKCRPRH